MKWYVFQFEPSDVASFVLLVATFLAADSIRIWNPCLSPVRKLTTLNCSTWQNWGGETSGEWGTVPHERRRGQTKTKAVSSPVSPRQTLAALGFIPPQVTLSSCVMLNSSCGHVSSANYGLQLLLSFAVKISAPQNTPLLASDTPASMAWFLATCSAHIINQAWWHMLLADEDVEAQEGCNWLIQQKLNIIVPIMCCIRRSSIRETLGSDTRTDLCMSRMLSILSIVDPELTTILVQEEHFLENMNTFSTEFLSRKEYSTVLTFKRNAFLEQMLFHLQVITVQVSGVNSLKTQWSLQLEFCGWHLLIYLRATIGDIV